jgi:DNA repair exonuclease SbcCD ATPase subunit
MKPYGERSKKMLKFIEEIKEKIEARKDRIDLVDQERAEKSENEKEVIVKINEMKSLLQEKKDEYKISHDKSVLNEIATLTDRLEELRDQIRY